MDCAALQRTAATYTGRRQALADEVARLRSKAEALATRKLDIEGAILRIQQAARDTQDQLKVRLQDIVQGALDVVFPGSYQFKVEFVPRRGRTEVDMWLDKDGTRMDPLDSNGGGVVDVISLALRVACLTLSSYSRVLILDEPFPRIRGKARQRLGDMVTKLAHELGIQVIMVADVSDTGIVPDKEFRVRLNQRRHSIVEELEPEASGV